MCPKYLVPSDLLALAEYAKNFVKSFGWFETPARELFIAMEYLAKGDLRKYLHASPPLTIVEAQHIAFQLLEGLSAMHEHGFAHRDLKPGVCHSRPGTEQRELIRHRTSSYNLIRRKNGG